MMSPSIFDAKNSSLNEPLKQHGQLHRGQAPTFSNEVATLESNNNSLSIIKKG
jgi:hypothetical protein